MTKFFGPNSIFCRFKNGQKSIFELGKTLKLPKIAISRKKNFFIYLISRVFQKKKKLKTLFFTVKEIIGMKIEELRDDYDHILSEKRKYLLNSDNHNSSIHSLEESCKITNKGLLVKAAVVLAITVILFFLQNIPSLNLSLGWTALLGKALKK